MTPAKKRKLKRQTCRIAGQLNIPNDVLFGPVFYDKTGELYKTYLSNPKFLRGQTIHWHRLRVERSFRVGCKVVMVKTT